MVKLKYLFLVVLIAGFIASCQKNTPIEQYDPVPQFKADTAAIRAFVKARNIVALKDENSGIFYQIITPGAGNITYNSSTNITVDYTGTLLDGTVFDSSKGTPRTFVLGGLIPGWQIGIQKIQKGGKIRLIIPSYYGYGTTAVSGVPANSILDFTIELTNVQ